MDTIGAMPVEVVPQEMRPPDAIAMPVRFFVVARLLANKTELRKPHKTELLIQTDDGVRTFNLAFQVVVPENPNLPQGWEQSLIIPVELSFPPKRFGHHSVEITIDDDHKKSIPFRIQPMEFQQQQMGG
ncbi:MAG TPA: hypothetical protein VGG89_17775 [Candidatus Baltobacteraceae bacterium]